MYIFVNTIVKMLHQNFDVLNQIGTGSYSTVFKVKRRTDDKIYALKKVKIKFLKPKEKRNALNEVRFLASINHKNIVGYKEAFIEPQDGHLCIIMELADGMDALRFVKSRKSYIPETRIWSIFI